MPGVKRAVNPQLKLAGDGVGSSNLAALQNLCAGYPGQQIHGHGPRARKPARGLCAGPQVPQPAPVRLLVVHQYPAAIDEITRLRLELLGLSFTPQHSDARVLDQIIYKWQHSRRIIAQVPWSTNTRPWPKPAGRSAARKSSAM